MGKSTISMVIFNSYVKLPEGNDYLLGGDWNMTGLFVFHILGILGMSSSQLTKSIIFQGVAQPPTSCSVTFT